ncbi:MAG TPA: NUDIX domain-containing protein [Nocardioides sp.]|jgi:8-oxo-dGTP pyrophosphatase MutT (NUDIX family)|uniref:NUDIX hydrolase n=1 Tax=Nocardioides sp. TaxID=35761 RepID=UPI002CCB0F32|nr:NUDIX domain-containing protein [Nocardioides sp.]HTW17789.1 NUDIX domain-containing protein [Nocardioides sp.]
MPIPPFVVELRKLVGSHELWLPAVTAVVVRDGQVLLTLRSDNGQWAPITGIVDPGEEPGVAARREALEETGVEISVDRLASVSVSPQITHTNGDLGVYLDLTFACSWLSGEPYAADDENTDVRWWPVDDLPPMSDFLLPRLEAALSGEVAPRFAV